MSATRRLYLYLITAISLGVTAGGAGQLISLILDLTVRSRVDQVGGQEFSAGQLSLGLAMLAIGAPLWYFFWRAVQQRTAGDVEETGSALRKFYLNLVLVVASLTAVSGTSETLRWLLGGAIAVEFQSGALAAAIVAFLIWLYHWKVAEKEGHPSPAAGTLRRWYMYILSTYGLVSFATSVAQFINAGVLSLPFFSPSLVEAGFWNGATQMAVANIITGGGVWYFHWFRMAKDDYDSVLRQVYFYLLTVSGGAIAALVAATVTVQRLVTFAIGGVTVPPGSYFSFIGWAIPTILIGTAIWGYHQRLAKEESSRITERRESAERIHHYLMSFIGLSTMSAGIILLFGLIINLLIGITGQIIIAGTTWWQGLLGLSLALLIVGTPLWLYYWGGVLKRIEAGGIEEWRATSRRIFLYAVVVLSIGTLIADLVNIVYQILNGILQAHADTIIRESRWSIQTLLVAGPWLWYHLRIIRIDQKRGSEALAARRKVTLLTYDRGGTTSEKFEKRLGYRITTMLRAGTGEDGILTDEELNRIAAEIEASPANRVLLVKTGDNFAVIAYEG
ncbi:MAG: DUF5671 domain-containing protein [Dehalococcoidales bacterium]|nr:DUF5671 domain-containing protein [Dehalococcoidales bacterium]